MIKHHPSTQLLTDFSAGSLPFGQSLCIAVHRESCPDCQKRIRKLNSLGGQLLESLAPAAVNDDLLNQVMARIESNEPAPVPAPEQAPIPAPSGVPRALAKLVPEGFGGIAWKRATSSLYTAPLRVGDEETQVSLIRMRPGGRIDRHTHGGNELTVVLKGGFSDERGSYKAGDLVACSHNDMHQPIAHQNEDCICLAAQDAPIRFTGIKGFFINPLLGFHPG